MRLRRPVGTPCWRWLAGPALGFVVLGGLAGCANQRVTLDAPVQWWHDLEGGTIAEQRPPPPGVGLPYPKLGTVPARPALPDIAARVGQTDRLAAQREQVERVVTRTPLPPPGSATAQALASQGVAPPGAPPGTPAAGAPRAAATPAPGIAAAQAPVAPAPARTAGAVASGGAPVAGAPAAAAALPSAAASGGGDATLPAAPGTADPNVASATLAAAAAPAPPPPAKNRASGPVAPVQRATPQELAVLQESAPAAGTPLLVAGRTADSGVVLPPLAAEPPLPPSFEVAAADGVLPDAGRASSRAPGQGAPVRAAAGELLSRAATGEPLSRAAPQEPLSRRGTPVRFQPGTATLLADQAGVLRALAARRGAAPVAVTGYGDAGADTPDAQSEALSLGLRRAQAMSAVLGTYGVPAEAIRIGAEAFGRGGTVRLIH